MTGEVEDLVSLIDIVFHNAIENFRSLVLDVHGFDLQLSSQELEKISLDRLLSVCGSTKYLERRTITYSTRIAKFNREPHKFSIELREGFEDRQIQLFCIHAQSYLAANQAMEVVLDSLQSVWWQRSLYHWAENVIQVEYFHLVSKLEGSQVGMAEFRGPCSECFCPCVSDRPEHERYSTQGSKGHLLKAPYSNNRSTTWTGAWW